MRGGLVGAVRLLATSHLGMGSRTNTEEVTLMVETTNEPSGVKTLGVRVPAELHPQFVLVAKLDGLSLNDACVRGIELYVESRQSEPDFKARVAEVLEEIEQEANSRRSASQALLGPATPAPADKPASGTTRRRGKGTAAGTACVTAQTGRRDGRNRLSVPPPNGRKPAGNGRESR